MIALEGHDHVTVIGFFEQLVAIINPMIFLSILLHPVLTLEGELWIDTAPPWCWRLYGRPPAHWVLAILCEALSLGPCCAAPHGALNRHVCSYMYIP